MFYYLLLPANKAGSFTPMGHIAFLATFETVQIYSNHRTVHQGQRVTWVGEGEWNMLGWDEEWEEQ